MTLRQVIYRVASGGGAALNFFSPATLGAQLSSLLRVTPAQTAGVAVSMAPASVTSAETLGVALTNASSGTVKPAETFGVAVQPTLVTTGSTKQNMGAEVVQVVYSLVSTVGSNAATSTGTTAWPSITNAQGVHDAALATATGSATAAQTFTARLAYPTQVNKTDLTISAVSIKYYTSFTSNAGLASLQRNVTWTGGSYNPAAVTATFNALTTPQVVDLFALGLTTWAQVSSVVATTTFTAPLPGNVHTCSIDAVELVVTASVTDLL